jgi:CheY-like chemotaxis protein
MKLKLAHSAPPGEENRSDEDAVAKILAVDDDPANLVAIQAMLQDLGQPVVCVRSGEEALRKLLTEDFAVILLDVLMPGMDGYETASMIRSREKTRHVPIIFLSAMNKEPSHLLRAYSAGAVDYVFKPVEPMILRSKVAVFVELQKRAHEIRRQAEHEKRLLADNLLVRTEQRRTEAALERSLAQQSLVIEALPLALYVASAGDGFRSRRIVGGQLEALLGAGAQAAAEAVPWMDFVHPADLPRVLEAVEEMASTHVFSAEYRLRCADGKYRWFSDRAASNKDNRQEQFGVLLDISERRLLQEQLVHAQKMEAIGQMTGGIAHDFNNMLSVIIGSLDRAIAMPALDAKLKSRLSLAMQAAASCADLTKRLLGFARRQALEPRDLDLCAELARLREMVERLLGAEIEAEIACEDGLWPVYMDAPQLEAAIINLVVNGRDAMPEGGRIRLCATNRTISDAEAAALDLKAGDYVELAVTDTGTGMPEEVKSRAFEPFFTTKEAGKGTGLGLSTIYGFLRQSGGTAAIESEVGAGTTIRLFLPRAAAAPQARPAARTQTAGELAGCRVLLVEDEKQVRDLAASMLEEMGCSVCAAENGDEAMRRLESGTAVSLLFTDCMMPGRLDGPSLALEVRRRLPGLPVLFTSGVRRGLPDVGNDAENLLFLPKPYSADQLQGALRSLRAAETEPRTLPPAQ